MRWRNHRRHWRHAPHYRWSWQGQPLAVAYETLGQGEPLLLPAFSTVASRGELRGLAQRLAAGFGVVALDWPGLGDSDRPPLAYTPELYRQFLQDFGREVLAAPVPVVAPGQAAGYAIALAERQPPLASQLVLVAPTWQGPLVAMSGQRRRWHALVRRLVRAPGIGSALYGLNTLPAFLRAMYAGHVYCDHQQLTPAFIRAKQQIARQPGARFAPAAFVTGALDPVAECSAALARLQPPPLPTLVLVAEDALRQSRANMEALAALPEVQSARIPGALGAHEEFPEATFEAMRGFLPLA
ncbi:MAG: alpha/beta hydrolase [Cyanobacteria bacterium QS_8_64_29]|nr:MAG: alpha/beta hydrolase [Cyanobacteria bacterium QS_8_64_29]